MTLVNEGPAALPEGFELPASGWPQGVAFGCLTASAALGASADGGLFVEPTGWFSWPDMGTDNSACWRVCEDSVAVVTEVRVMHGLASPAGRVGSWL